MKVVLAAFSRYILALNKLSHKKCARIMLMKLTAKLFYFIFIKFWLQWHLQTWDIFELPLRKKLYSRSRARVAQPIMHVHIWDYKWSHCYKGADRNIFAIMKRHFLAKFSSISEWQGSGHNPIKKEKTTKLIFKNTWECVTAIKVKLSNIHSIKS